MTAEPIDDGLTVEYRRWTHGDVNPDPPAPARWDGRPLTRCTHTDDTGPCGNQATSWHAYWHTDAAGVGRFRHTGRCPLH